MRVSVIVVTWNGCHLLPDCLAALRRQTVMPHEVWVVDNGSRDGTEAFLEQQEWNLLKPVLLPENRGFAGGNNVAIRQASGDVVALLNNDARPEPGWIENGLQGFDDLQVGMVACRILRAEDTRRIDKAGHLMYPDGLNRGRGTGALDGERWRQDNDTLWPDGCAAFYRRDMLEEIGLLDEDFFLYGEDAELGMRARWAGYTCRYRSDSVVLHQHSASLGKFSPTKVFYVERNRIWLMLKTFPLGMILLSPCYTVFRHGLNLWSLVGGRGSAHGFRREHSVAALMWVFLKAHGSALAGVVKMWRKRKILVRKLGVKQMKDLLKAHRISARELVLED